MLTWRSAGSTRRCWARRRRLALLQVPEGDAPLGEVVGRKLQRDAVAGQDADVVLAHLAGAVGDQAVAVFQHDTESRVGKYFLYSPVDFNQFFFGQELAFGSVHMRMCGLFEP
jgi:hypothetical protein